MTMRLFVFVFLLIYGLAQIAAAQTETTVRRAAQGTVVSANEVVSFKEDVPYAKAIQSLGELSKKLDGKLLIDHSPMAGKDKPIGVNIESMYWKDALELILRNNQVWYNDYPEYREIVSIEDVGKQPGEGAEKTAASTPSGKGIAIQPPGSTATRSVVTDSSEYFAQTPEITISTVFFELDKDKMTQAGISWSLFRGKDLNLAVQVTGANKLTGQYFAAAVLPTDPKLPIDVNAAIALFENDQLGEVISRPQLTVRSGSPGKFQIGQDFSVLEKDFSGNTVQKFYPTGTILTVRPKLYKIKDLEFIDLQYSIEKSAVVTGGQSTLINKTAASGSMSLLNGEEGYVGGMFSNDETTVRQGVPILKDLPWWVFGLRYLFGYDSKVISKRELIVLMKAELLPLVEERATQKAALKNSVKDRLHEMEKDFQQKTGANSDK
jgi:general secretion pathway protein D